MTETAASDTQAGDDCSWGYQLIIDCFGCTEETCCDLDNGYEFLDQICAHLNMTKQTQPYIFKTCERAFPGRPGYSGWVPIIESGIQIHTSAKNRFVSVDVYSCRKFDSADVVAYVQKWFGAAEVDTQFFHRGRNYLAHRASAEARDRQSAAPVAATI